MRPAFALTFLLGAVTGVALAAERNVPGDFATLQAAIDAAVAGDTVLVEPGTYSENISLRSGIDVRGRETARTLLRPAGAGPTVTMSGIVDTTLANLTIIDSTIGVLVLNGADLLITNMVVDSALNVAVDIDANTTVEVRNSVFFRNNTAIVRRSAQARIVNNLFVGNTSTVVSPIDFPGFNIEFNGYFANIDLRQGDIDTGIGTNFQIGDPEFVDTGARDFHLRQNSIAIDAGTGTDVIDDTVADLGAYGGADADARPFPVSAVSLRDTSAASPPPFAITVSWNANEAYLVSDTAAPGSYRVHYRLNEPGPPYDGTDAGGGTRASPIDVSNVTSFVLADLSPTTDTPSPTVLQSAEPRSNGVALAWSAVAGASGYRVLYGVASTSEHSLDVGAVTSATVTGLDNGTTYRFAVAAKRQPSYHVAVTVRDGTQNQNESVLSEDRSLALGSPTASVPSNELTATPGETVPVPALPDDRCFIATAAYGALWAPQVEILRAFRDRYLMSHAIGRAFVDWYYARGSAAAAFLAEHPGLKPFVRSALTPVVWLALVLLTASLSQMLALAVLGVSLVYRLRVCGPWCSAGGVRL